MGDLKGWENGMNKGHKSKQSCFEKCKERVSLERSMVGVVRSDPRTYVGK